MRLFTPSLHESRLKLEKVDSHWFEFRVKPVQVWKVMDMPEMSLKSGKGVVDVAHNGGWGGKVTLERLVSR